ncbi:MAG TPA: metallophosphoesterase [Candidatus Limnocylindrales bacterium]|nr:metallophosphoesterase [Candidatus Limnocylindrales bacterium]
MADDPSQFSTVSFSNRNLAQLLHEYRSSALLRFVHLSDTHISADPNYTIAEADYPAMAGARELVRQVNALPFAPDFVLHTGDVTFDPQEDAYLAARDILSGIKYPTYYVPGNHDKAEMLQRAFLGRQEILPSFDYEFEVNGVQVVCIDSSTPTQYAGGVLLPEQLANIERIVSARDDRPLIVGIHHNVLPIGAPFWDTFMRLTNGEDLHQLLVRAKDRLRGVFHGHVHMATDTYTDGVLYTTVPSSWYQLECWPGQSNIIEDRGAEPGFNVVTVTRTQTFIRRHRFHVPEHGSTTPREAATGLRAES